MGQAAKKKKLLRSSKNDLAKITQAIKSLTDKINQKKASTWTEQQVQEIENTRNLYGFVLCRVRYLIFQNAGYSFEDPLDKLPLLGHQQQIEVISNLLFGQFNLISKGWNQVKQAAVSEQREFNFEHPIELFFEVCQQMAEADLAAPLDKNINQGDSLTATRIYLRDEAKFYRDKLESEETNLVLNEFRNSKYWWRFVIYSIWHHKFKPDLKHTWIEFLKSHKSWVKFNCNKKPIENAKLVAFKWQAGLPVNAKSSQPIKFHTN